MSFPGYAITTDDLDGKKKLKGSDIIELTEGGSGTDDYITLNLTEQGSNWWKAIMLFQPNGDSSTIVSVSAFAPYVATGIVTPGQLAGNGMVLSKAGGFGAHTNVYHITNAAEYFKAGKVYTFNWLAAW